ncbi:PilN domain-containing protein [Thiorhodococcus mannitoliphagus]|uniref:PilN domain-containing protein n=1 Tax=Thiorhodococcus mannitoliphagus TaxID=329406 RepID=A0A6P1DSN8_9GAMM|nr:PilN domain-containing protein [Thiorhodococcus mannitoliphagus]NEX18725.1 PilN domain-containing protein [Thiorhodococcus mannitoliphagus]
MARINLLPWREEARQQRRKDFLTALGLGLVVTFLGAILVHLYFEDRISSQQARNTYLKTEIASLDRKIKEIQNLEKTKADLLARMDIIQKLQTSRPEIVRLFDELISALPSGVYLTKVQQSGRSVVIEGRAQSNARVSAFMGKIEQSEWIGNPRLMLIENKDKTGTGLSHFRLSFDQVSPKKADETDEQV